MGPLEPDRRTIVLVEDDEAIRDCLEQLLTDEGFGVYAFDRGERALEFLSGGWSVDLMLVDLHLGSGISGGQVAMRFRESRPQHLPILAISGAVLSQDEVLRLGADAMLSKPFDVERLLRIVGEMVRNPSNACLPV